jgi:hypothetical protein
MERLILTRGLQCLPGAERSDFRINFVSQTPPVFPTYLDASGNEVRIVANSLSEPLRYYQRLPERTLISGERIILFSDCNTNLIEWKLPISPTGRVNLSKLGASSDLSVDEAASLFVNVVKDDPTTRVR